MGGAAASRDDGGPARVIEWQTIMDINDLLDPHLLTSMNLLRPNPTAAGRWWCPCTQVCLHTTSEQISGGGIRHTR